jgi:hypothetical protein
MSSRIVTISDPNAIEPRENVEARTKADKVGCLGWGEITNLYKRTESD